MKNNPLRGFTIRLPKPLPQVPTVKEVEAVLSFCAKDTITGKRNRALILAMADAGLRASEILRLRLAHWNPHERSLFVRGKGEKDRRTFVDLPTAKAMREYLATRGLKEDEDFLFVNDDGRPMNRRRLIQILHRLSEKAGLPKNRRLHPHLLRNLLQRIGYEWEWGWTK
jgi:site-specific recombinase XerD